MTDHRYFKEEGGASVRIILGPDAPSMGFHDAAADSKTHAEAGLLRCKKRLEGALQKVKRGECNR